MVPEACPSTVGARWSIPPHWHLCSAHNVRRAVGCLRQVSWTTEACFFFSWHLISASSQTEVREPSWHPEPQRPSLISRKVLAFAQRCPLSLWNLEHWLGKIGEGGREEGREGGGGRVRRRQAVIGQGSTLRRQGPARLCPSSSEWPGSVPHVRGQSPGSSSLRAPSGM